MSHFFNNLIALATERGLSIRAVSDGAGLPPSTLSRYVKRGPSANIRTSTILSVSKFFDVSPEDIVEKELRPPVDAITLAKIAPAADIDSCDSTPAKKPHAIPLVNDDIATHLINNSDIPLSDSFFDNRDYETVPPPVFTDLQMDDRLLAYKVTGDAMYPLIPSNSIVYFVRPEPNEDIPSGSLVLATTLIKGCDIFEEFDAEPFVTVRRYTKDEFGRIWLNSDNNQLPENTKIVQGGTVIGRVVAWCARA